MPLVGLTLQPEVKFLELVEPLLDGVDYFEIAPETAWRTNAAGTLEQNGFARRFLELGARYGKAFVGHGVGYSLGTAARGDRARRRRWIERLSDDARHFRFLWYSEHLGATSLDGKAMTLPMPIPMSGFSAEVVVRRLGELRVAAPDVAVENTASYFLLGDALDEPAFLNRIAEAPRTHLLLDLHNLHAMSVNMGFDARAYLDALDTERVIEIHLAGGVASEAAWLPSGRRLVLDSHDHAVPEEVWRLFEAALSRCPNLRGVTLERMEGTVEESDVAILREELGRLRRIVDLVRPDRHGRERERSGWRRTRIDPSSRGTASPRAGSADEHEAFERVLARAMTSRDPEAALSEVIAAGTLPEPLRTRLSSAVAEFDGLRLSALLVARLRFERLLHGSAEAARDYEADPESFTERFRAYHHAVPPAGFFRVKRPRIFVAGAPLSIVKTTLEQALRDRL